MTPEALKSWRLQNHHVSLPVMQIRLSDAGWVSLHIPASHCKPDGGVQGLVNMMRLSLSSCGEDPLQGIQRVEVC